MLHLISTLIWASCIFVISLLRSNYLLLCCCQSVNCVCGSEWLLLALLCSVFFVSFLTLFYCPVLYLLTFSVVDLFTTLYILKAQCGLILLKLPTTLNQPPGKGAMCCRMDVRLHLGALVLPYCAGGRSCRCASRPPGQGSC